MIIPVTILGSIAPAIFTGGEALSTLWIFIIAPLLGAAMATFTHNYLES
ncbi:hypothetical protein [Macrococcoides caseolyticum]|nr:hypothetical protein [Macrococcus caseolyticus]